MRRFKATFVGVGLVVVMVAFAGCAIDQLAVNVLADTLAGGDGGGASVFTEDSDPELVGDALPFALKLYETILAQAPEHEQLLYATGSGFVSYGVAFVAMPSSMLGFEEWERQQAMQFRAKALYLRGREYLIRGLEVRYPGFREALFDKEIEPLLPYLEQMTAEDVGFLYWISAAWVAAFSLDAFDLELGFTIPKVNPIILRALELDEDFNDGAIHDFLVQYYAGLPETIGGDKTRVDFHHERSLELADGRLAGPYMSYAESVLIARQDYDRFIEYMDAILAIDPEAYPAGKLLNILTQRKAAWYLENIDDYFLLDLPLEDVEGS